MCVLHTPSIELTHIPKYSTRHTTRPDETSVEYSAWIRRGFDTHTHTHIRVMVCNHLLATCAPMYAVRTQWQEDRSSVYGYWSAIHICSDHFQNWTRSKYTIHTEKPCRPCICVQQINVDACVQV